jgi:hypothetical protein
VQLARAQAVGELVEDPRSPDQRDVCSSRAQPSAYPAADRSGAKHGDACHEAPGSDGTTPAISICMNELIKSPKNEQGAIGYILAWLLGIPVSVLLLVFIIRGCT